MPILWWALLAGLWLLIAGTKALLEVYAGLIAAAIAAAGIEVVRRTGITRFEPEGGLVLRALAVPLWIVVDFAIVTAALVRSLARGRRVEGSFVSVPFAAGEQTARHAFRRGLAAASGSMHPNAVVVDLDPERRTALVHAIDPRRRTAREVP